MTFQEPVTSMLLESNMVSTLYDLNSQRHWKDVEEYAYNATTGMIDRSSYPPTLTPAGRLFREAADDILNRLFDTRAIIRTEQRMPGIGLQMIQAINGRDLVLIQGLVLITALLFVGANLLVDISYVFLDPRIER